ncbi:MAG: VanW family protein [Candidatus Levyibacteriota bacterium]
MKSKTDHKKEKRGLRHLSLHALRHVFWFFIGASFALFCLATFFLIYFRFAYKDRIIPGVFIGNMYVGEKAPRDVDKNFKNLNNKIGKAVLTFSTDNETATISAQDLHIGYDSKLMAEQAASIGKGSDMISNTYYIALAYLNGIYLSPAYTSSLDSIQTLLDPIQKKIHVEPVDALFKIENNKVVAFRQSSDGATIDFNTLQTRIEEEIPAIMRGDKKNFTFQIPVKILKPVVSTDKANNLGIIEEIGQGSSFFAHSIPGRIHNVALAASKINGVLVAPGEEFSFDKNLGDVTQYTGYQQAYIIQNGKTVLGDGGGVCQVSTTLFRAILNSGLPITDRTAHAYRVGYYEQDSPPGLDATVYFPSVDLKFKNDTGNYILIVADTDLSNLKLTFTMYGKKDGRQVTLTTPVVTNQIPAPADLYQDDPTLPVGQVKQIDFAAAGATVIFSRTVTKNGKPIIQDTYKSVYQPWQAIFLRGTKTG